MIRTILIFILVLFLAWVSIDYFSITLPSVVPTKKEQVDRDKAETSTQKSMPKGTTNVSVQSSQKDETLTKLLKEHKFYDALAYYLDNTTEEHTHQMETFLASLAKQNPTLALEYMQVFWDNVPQSKIWKQMILTHINQDNLQQAIALIMQVKEDYVSESEDKRLATQLREVSLKHIDRLLQQEKYAQLIAFLEEMITYDSTDNFYAFRLAQLYIKLDKTDEASLLLEGLKYDEVYAQNVKTLLNSIDNKEEEHYEYAIPLQHYGEHYVVTVLLDGTAFNLVLDTGATFIFIDEDKASMFEVLRDDLVLQTAGNDVHAKLCSASTMKIGNLELSNIQVTIAPFKRDGIDGLLGMNFFKQFTFFINQEEDILYLNPKSR